MMVKGKLKILLVEDNEDHVFLIKKALSSTLKEKTEVNVVTDGEEAIHYVKRLGPFRDRSKPDLILLDLKLPKKDGFEVLEALKQDSRYKSIPVVVLTSSDREVDIIKSYALGANSYITKPISVDSLVEKVKQIPLYWARVSSLPPKEGER
jgi:CheY-like chemotaxis protein